METIANQLITALDTINKLTNELSKLKTAHIILNNKYCSILISEICMNLV